MMWTVLKRAALALVALLVLSAGVGLGYEQVMAGDHQVKLSARLERGRFSSTYYERYGPAAVLVVLCRSRMSAE